VRTIGKEDKGKEQGRISVLQLSSIVMVRQQKTDYCLRLNKNFWPLLGYAEQLKIDAEQCPVMHAIIQDGK